MIEKKIQVVNRLGLHARPAAMVVQKASRFKSEIRLVKDEFEVNAKSIMSVMMLAAEKGSFIIIKAWGEDESVAVEEIAKLFEGKFGEE
ncbi:MAG: HPr family phosphocarrier protein [candidate division Zixibacteria bacterium]|nr:HPr family phosphocarrier protein [candidate division Zixibacteria bacterium]